MTRVQRPFMILLVIVMVPGILLVGHVIAQDWNKLVEEYEEHVEKAAYEYFLGQLEAGKTEKEARKRLISAVDKAANDKMEEIIDKTMTPDGKMPETLFNMMRRDVFRRAKEKAKAAGVARAIREYRAKNWREIEPGDELVDKIREDKDVKQEIKKTTLFDDFKDIAELKLTKPVIIFFFVGSDGNRRTQKQARECVRMQKELFPDRDFFNAATEFIQLRVDMAKLNKPLLNKYKVRSAPAVAFFDCTGKLLYSFNKVKQNVPKLVKRMEGFVAKSRKARERALAQRGEARLEPARGKIFNGKNLDDFEADQDVFKVRKKCVFASQRTRNSPAHLLWERPVKGDFVFSVKLIIEEKHGHNISFGGGKVPVGAGLVFGYDKAKKQSYRFWTEAVYGENGYVGLSGGRFSYLKKMDAGKSWIEIKVKVDNKTLKTYFNGKEINSADFLSYKGGKIGVYVHMCDARFKDFKLHEEEPAAAREPRKETPNGTVAKERLHPRKDAVAERILKKLEQISPQGYVAVPAGEFLMGAGLDYPGVRRDQRPQHKVLLDAFFIKKHEVTQKEYKPFIDETGTTPPGGKNPGNARRAWRKGTYPPKTDNCPVVLVTWQECMEYCKWLSNKTGRTCSLPTEAQWEKAATWNFVKEEKYIYPWGNTPPGSDWIKEPAKIGGGEPVGGNPHDISFCGCWDMLDNAVEYCLDVYDSDYYKNSPRENPKGPRGFPRDKDHHTQRGSKHLGLTGRTWGGPGINWRGVLVGFRVVIEPTENETFLIGKIVETKGEFDVEAYLEKEKQKKLANYDKRLFKGNAKKKGNTLTLTYSFNKAEQLQDWVFAQDVTKPHEISDGSGMWDVLESDRSFSGGGKGVVLSKAVFTEDASFEVEFKVRTVKDLVFIVASADKREALAACFALDEHNSIFATDYAKRYLAKGYINLIFKLDKGKFQQHMCSCNEKELTMKAGKARSSGELRIMSEITDSMILSIISARLLVCGRNPIGKVAKLKPKPRKKYKLKIRVKEGFVLFHLDRNFFGFTTALQGGFRFGFAALSSFVDVTKVKMSGQIDQEWLEKEVEK